MRDTGGNLFTREDTFFGVCEGIGEDFGFNPNWLRVTFAPLLFFSWQGAIALYLALGLLVFATRWFIPNPRASKAPATPNTAEPLTSDAEALPLAA